MLSSILLLSAVCAASCNANGYDIIAEIVEEFQRLCPYSDTCYSVSNNSYSFDDFLKAPCCGFCLCDEVCEQSFSCCPDKMSRVLREDEMERLKSEKEECVNAYVGSAGQMIASESFQMISRCPRDFEDNYVRDKCHMNYNQFDFSEKLSYLPPYSSDEKKLIYKNYHCAKCNNADMLTLVQWFIKITCYDYFFQLSDIYLLPGLIGWKCELHFVPPNNHDWVQDNSCSYSIDRCNTTGLWKTYDLQLELACLSYRSVYKGYKNVHCYLCNGFNREDIESTCDLQSGNGGAPSFLALLDFNDLEDDISMDQENPKCQPSSVLDYYSGECRQMVCPNGFILNGYNCLPLMKSLEKSVYGTVVEIPFILVPSPLAKESQIYDVFSTAISIVETAKERLWIVITTDDIREGTLNVYVKLKYTLKDIFDRMNETRDTNLVHYVSHIEVMMQVIVAESSNMTKTIQELALLFLENEYYNQYYIRHKQIGHKYDARYNSKMSLFEKTDAMDSIFDGGIPPTPPVFSAIMDEFEDPVDGLSVFLIPRYRYTKPYTTEIVVQPNPFCSRLELLDNEFVVNTIEKSASRDEMIEDGDKNQRVIYNFSTVVENLNGTGIFVCSEEFAKQSNKGQHQQESSKALTDNSTRRDESVILTIVCLVVSLVSLILTLIIYALLPQLRTLPGMNVMALSTCLIISYSLSLANSLISLSPSSISCQIIGIGLHFSLLSGFLWMFICTYHMMRVFMTIKERSHARPDCKTFIRYSLFAECLSMLVVCFLIIASVESGDGLGYGGSPCYITNSKFILYFVAVPLGIVLISNIVMFCTVTIMVMRIPQVGTSTRKERNNLLIFLKLSTLTGFAWIFGFLFQFTEVLLFAYLFIVCNAGQGLFIMLSFVANHRVYGMLFRSDTYSESSTTNAPSRTTTTSLETRAKDERF
ncbi:hypothetical protein ACF0H5_016942 [Mactra antiquata]